MLERSTWHCAICRTQHPTEVDRNIHVNTEHRP
jgi:hypothetical protein